MPSKSISETTEVRNKCDVGMTSHLPLAEFDPCLCEVLGATVRGVTDGSMSSFPTSSVDVYVRSSSLEFVHTADLYTWRLYVQDIVSFCFEAETDCGALVIKLSNGRSLELNGEGKALAIAFACLDRVRRQFRRLRLRRRHRNRSRSFSLSLGTIVEEDYEDLPSDIQTESWALVISLDDGHFPGANEGEKHRKSDSGEASRTGYSFSRELAKKSLRPVSTCSRGFRAW
eukprot:CAMPEP_0196654170 /NCGR_PEP_ID=MMETSP1086-20130531/3847_1 /TAXON_ID=77921 /ORGANISM="Cyanoptyche  gloeocystis , Strain SAG4.97" /LENGTH=228 /DNA_ID=CAMNT_0041985763 /DNA_START=354 /DNA_END=1037 /DNA_ORIENTATION=+